MTIAYNKIFNEVANLLGAGSGFDAFTAETNYNATLSTSNVIGPDFTPSKIADAVAATLVDIVRTICETPRHPDRSYFRSVTAALGNRAVIPNVDLLGFKVIGIPGRVSDSSNGQPLKPQDLDTVRSYTRHSATIYSQMSPYWYCINGNVIEHTRTNVLIEVCVFERPSPLTGNIPLPDSYEWPLTYGAVAFLAPKEGMYASLHSQCLAKYNDHLQQIRALGAPELATTAQTAPSTT
jgi:hypothetical protein